MPDGTWRNALMARLRTSGQRRHKIEADPAKLVSRLSASKRRKLDASEPGALLIFDSENRQARDRASLRRGELGPARAGSARITTQVLYGSPLAFAGDVRGLVRFVQLAAAMHFHESIKRQTEADGSKRLPSKMGGRDGLFGVDTGDFYTSFRLRAVKGSSVKAQGVVMTPGEVAKKIEFAASAYKRGIDLVSSRGTASRVIADAFKAYLDAAFGAGVKVPQHLPWRSNHDLRQAAKARMF